MRVLFAFDIRSRAIMLIAGDKAGNWSKWYAKHIPIADDLFTAHQVRLRREETEGAKTVNRKPRRGKKR